MVEHLGSHESFVDAGSVRPGPTYADWLWLSGYRWTGAIVCGEGDPIPDDTYTPRSLLGRYLHWCFDYICASVPEGIVVVMPRCPESTYD
ncbi:protein of unknown function [Methylorubrum extorquens DM4]|uniref:FAD-dependent urate hydroxylase HpyO/Asp monooxygenase CreE-like FAD/NAD(P)-binding domain-containing protein n=1 Tax=Methylorubrum extorquens (strain DSM 6343 / CIP 106787 / DM4) TaxID=661410 RepID=C7CE95_METED|nr:protein of unknown function [Methylorubrum extorquens DM4]